jgi:autotransporter translocation and assembly factor TamB
MASLALDVAVTIDRNAWIRRADANIELGGALRVDKAPGGPARVSGTIRLVRGWYAFQGRRFNLDEGTILFTGEDPPNPGLEITASYRTGDTRVFVEIGGTAEKPTLTLSSDPTMEQGDILAVLLFGKPASELGRGESLDFQRQALSLASGYVMPELRTSVLETLGLDTFEVGLEEVRAGRYVAQDVFVSLAQEFGTQAGQVVGLEYSLTPNVSVKASTSTRGNSSVDLQWHRRY